MHPEQIFLRTCDDIDEAISARDGYKILRASALLRQLLLDDFLAEVKRPYGLKIHFTIADSWQTKLVQLMLESGPIFYGTMDGLSPRTSMLKDAPIQVLNLDRFLKHRVALIQGNFVTVQDVIDHCANSMGGVHYRTKPAKSHQQTIRTIDGLTIGGAQFTIGQLVPVLMVVIDAMSELRQRVKENQCSHG